ncbi:MAG: hypothetical protein PHH82_02710 [Candidatus ainarchaeum sp.]|nr:hypothetical protein [Candidatus ainarchaeum sp.]
MNKVYVDTLISKAFLSLAEKPKTYNGIFQDVFEGTKSTFDYYWGKRAGVNIGSTLDDIIIPRHYKTKNPYEINWIKVYSLFLKKHLPKLLIEKISAKDGNKFNAFVSSTFPAKELRAIQGINNLSITGIFAIYLFYFYIFTRKITDTNESYVRSLLMNSILRKNLLSGISYDDAQKNAKEFEENIYSLFSKLSFSEVNKNNFRDLHGFFRIIIVNIFAIRISGYDGLNSNSNLVLNSVDQNVKKKAVFDYLKNRRNRTDYSPEKFKTYILSQKDEFLNWNFILSELSKLFTEKMLLPVNSAIFMDTAICIDGSIGMNKQLNIFL